MKIKILDYKKILEDNQNSLNINSLQEYLMGGRKDVLYNTDIFCENVRTQNIIEKKFDLFERVEQIDDHTIIVFPIYLELFEYHKKYNSINYFIDYFATKYPNNYVVFFWNHDNNFAKYNKLVEKYDNVRIINYNTSKKTKNDIIVPFWSMPDINPLKEEKKFFCSFIGTINNQLRNNLVRTIYQKENYFYFFNLSSDEYKRKLSQTIFSLCPKGNGLSSYRFFECFHSTTIPVLIADEIILPFEEELNYDNLIVRIPEDKINDFEFINSKLKSINIEFYLKNIEENRKYFTLENIQNYVFNSLKVNLKKLAL